MHWKPASLLFKGSREEAAALTGRVVRLRRPLMSSKFLGSDHPQGEKINLPAGRTGLVGYPFGDMINVAFPNDATAPMPTSLAKLMKGDSVSISVNWPTFRAQFEIAP